MLLTEEEARRTSCPINRIAAALHTGTPDNCLASKCNWWKWVGTHVFDENALDNSGNKPGTRWDTRTYGCCGVTGDPFVQEKL